MPFGDFTCVLRTQFKEVLDVDDVIPSYKIRISVGMNDVNNNVLDRSKDFHTCFQCKKMSTYVDNLIKRNRAFWVLCENVFEMTCLFLFSKK